MGAQLAGCRVVEVPASRRLAGSTSTAIADADAERAPVPVGEQPRPTPPGRSATWRAAADWGRAHGVPVLSDECYAEFTWTGAPQTILSSGTDGVIAVHSLSKRSNLAGVRVGFYAGDAALVGYLAEIRKHAGLMVPGPVQAAAVVALADDAHVAEQRQRYHRRLSVWPRSCGERGSRSPLPAGGFYLWVPVPAWAEEDR